MAKKYFMAVIRDGKEYPLTDKEIEQAHEIVVRYDKEQARASYDDAIRMYLGQNQKTAGKLYFLLDDEVRKSYMDWAVDVMEAEMEDGYDENLALLDAIHEATSHIKQRICA